MALLSCSQGKQERIKPKPVELPIVCSEHTQDFHKLPAYAVDTSEKIYYVHNLKFVELDLKTGIARANEKITAILANGTQGYSGDYLSNVSRIKADEDYVRIIYPQFSLEIAHEAGTGFFRNSKYDWENEIMRHYKKYILKELIHENIPENDPQIKQSELFYPFHQDIPTDYGYIFWADVLVDCYIDSTGQVKLVEGKAMPNFPELPYPKLVWASKEHLLLYSNESRNKIYRVNRASMKIEGMADLSHLVQPPTRKEVAAEEKFYDYYTITRANGHYYLVYLKHGDLKVVKFDV